MPKNSKSIGLTTTTIQQNLNDGGDGLQPKPLENVSVSTQTTTPSTLKVNPWIQHVKNVRASNPQIKHYKDVLVLAKESYVKKSASV